MTLGSLRLRPRHSITIRNSFTSAVSPLRYVRHIARNDRLPEAACGRNDVTADAALNLPYCRACLSALTPRFGALRRSVR